MNLSFLSRLVLLAGVVVSTGCATYTTPGGGVSLAGIDDAGIEAAFSREPAAQFPANVAIVRVQAPGYVSDTNRGYGAGKFTVVTVRDIETEEDFERIGAAEGVNAVAPLTRILLPAELQSTASLREAAAQLRTDLLLIYTVDTAFRTDVGKVGPLQTIGLGFLPNRESHVDATVSAMVVDVRSGYVFGTAEVTATRSQRSDFWGTRAAIDKARLEAERAAFERAVVQIEALMADIDARYGSAAATAE